MIDSQREPRNVETAVAPLKPNADVVPPWEMIEPGRYQPKRIKGSCVGRELG